jgi:hypothetical protein
MAVMGATMRVVRRATTIEHRRDPICSQKVPLMYGVSTESMSRRTVPTSRTSELSGKYEKEKHIQVNAVLSG